MKFKSGLTHPSNTIQEHLDKLSKAQVLECLKIVVDEFPYFPNWLIHISRRLDAAEHIKRLKGRKGSRHLPEARGWLKEYIVRTFPEDAAAFLRIGAK